MRSSAGVLPKSQRPVQLVRDCSTAGPGWTHCDLTVEGQCPEEKDIVGTPYENVYSSIGQPPNNKIVQCVPPELVRLGKTASKSEEEQLNKRFYNALSVISKESENIRRLSEWREVAPCGAIPAMAFAKNDAMCDRLHFKDDRASPRCMTWNTAAKLGHGKQKKIAEDAVTTHPEMRTCFANPAEVTRKINADLRALDVLRQRLRGAVERAITVTNFSTRFNLLSSRLTGKYHNHSLKAENHGVPVAFSWEMVKDYILNSPTKTDDSTKGPPDCEKSKKEYQELKNMVQRKQLGGGGRFPDPPSAENEDDGAGALEGGGPTFGDECGESNHCGERILSVLQLMDRITKKEQDIRGRFQEWKLAQEALLNQLEKDAMCNKQGPDEGWCKSMQDQCGYDCTSKDVPNECIKVGNEWVDKSTQGATWQVEDFTAEGYPIGFRWLVAQDVRRLYADYKQMGEYTCNAKGRLTEKEHSELKNSYKKRSEKIDMILSQRYPKTHAMRRRMEAAQEQTEEQHAMKAVDMEAMLTNVVKAAVERIAGTTQAMNASEKNMRAAREVKKAKENPSDTQAQATAKEAISDAQRAARAASELSGMFGHSSINAFIDEGIALLASPNPAISSTKMDVRFNVDELNDTQKSMLTAAIASMKSDVEKNFKTEGAI